ATTSASLRYWNSARQRYCRQLARYRNTLASLPTRSPSQQPRPARKAGFSTFENDCGRETDCPLEGDGFELPVPRQRRHPSLPLPYIVAHVFLRVCTRLTAGGTRIRTL